MDGVSSSGGSRKILDDLLRELREADLGLLAERKGLTVGSDGCIEVVSFARRFRYGPEGVTAPDGGGVSFAQALAVVAYLLSDGRGEAGEDFVPFGYLGGFSVGREKHDDRSLKVPLRKRFGEAYPLFCRAARLIGGREEAGEGASGHWWLFHAFPKVPIRLLFCERDEEFPADVRVLFGTRALDFFGMRCLGFLPDYFVTTLLDAATAEPEP